MGKKGKCNLTYVKKIIYTAYLQILPEKAGLFTSDTSAHKEHKTLSVQHPEGLILSEIKSPKHIKIQITLYKTCTFMKTYEN